MSQTLWRNPQNSNHIAIELEKFYIENLLRLRPISDPPHINSEWKYKWTLFCFRQEEIDRREELRRQEIEEEGETQTNQK